MTDADNLHRYKPSIAERAFFVLLLGAIIAASWAVIFANYTGF